MAGGAGVTPEGVIKQGPRATKSRTIRAPGLAKTLRNRAVRAREARGETF